MTTHSIYLFLNVVHNKVLKCLLHLQCVQNKVSKYIKLTLEFDFVLQHTFTISAKVSVFN